MGKVTKRDGESLKQLVLDCSMYNFDEKDALEYIKTRFGKAISGRTYRRYKGNLQNGNLTQDWMNYFTRIGFMVTHQQVFQGAKYLLESSIRRLFEEENKSHNKDDTLILKLKQEIRAELWLVSQFSIGTPVISNIKEQSDEAIRKYDELVKKVRIRNPELIIGR